VSVAVETHTAMAAVLTAGLAVTIGAIARPAAIRTPRKIPGGRSTEPLRRRRRSWVGAAVFGATLGVLAIGPLAVGAAGATAVMVRRLAPMRAARRRRSDIERELPDAMDLLVLSVRAGLTPFQAVGELADSEVHVVGDAFAEVVHRTERGQQFADALAALPEHLGPPAAALADVIATSDRNGLALGPVLDQLTVEIRAARRRLDQAESRKLPIRLSFPLVTCTLPSFVLLAIAPAVIAALSSLGGTAW
jgi:Flp pilus assembly protein TadB